MSTAPFGSAATKQCTTCRVDKPLDTDHYFFRLTGQSSSQCKDCVAKRAKARRYSNLEATRAYGRNQAKAWRKAHPQESRARSKDIRTKRLYGLSREAYYAKLAVQGTCCAICGSTKPGNQGKFHLDHDHTTGKVRAFLCAPCNMGLGYFKDDPLRLELAAAYLRKYTES
jgi:hypothetical protein